MSRAATSRAWSSVPSQFCQVGGDGAGAGRSWIDGVVAVRDRRPDRIQPFSPISSCTAGSRVVRLGLEEAAEVGLGIGTAERESRSGRRSGPAAACRWRSAPRTGSSTNSSGEDPERPVAAPVGAEVGEAPPALRRLTCSGRPSRRWRAQLGVRPRASPSDLPALEVDARVDQRRRSGPRPASSPGRAA